jgi:hypothetical protein
MEIEENKLEKDKSGYRVYMAKISGWICMLEQTG